jgi:hypothetical protein
MAGTQASSDRSRGAARRRESGSPETGPGDPSAYLGAAREIVDRILDDAKRSVR